MMPPVPAERAIEARSPLADAEGTTLVEAVVAAAVLGVAVAAFVPLLGTATAALDLAEAVQRPTASDGAAEPLAREVRRAEAVTAARHRAAGLDGPDGWSTLDIDPDGGLIVSGPDGIERVTLRTAADRFSYLVASGARIQPLEGAPYVPEGDDPITAIVVVDADGIDVMVVALRDRGTG